MAIAPQHTIVVIDAVEWSAAYPNSNPLRNVGEWFARYLRHDAGLSVSVVSAADVEPAAIAAPGIIGIVMSGSPRDAWVPDPINAKLSEVIHQCHRRALPFLGVCYGHQLLGVAMGARVGREPAGVELGNVPIALTEAGRNDPLFAGVPAEFSALQSHQDAVLSLPDGAELLATGRHTRIQGFRWGEWLRGVQFHPEHDPEILRFIWEPRRATWRERCTFDIDARLRELQPTPCGPQILRNFAQFCLRSCT